MADIEPNKQQTSQIDSSATVANDALLDCLLWFANTHYQPIARQSLIAGLPLVNHRLTPELFVRAAQRAKLAAQISAKNLQQLNNLMLPAVLLLKNQRACILLKIDLTKNQAQIIYPEINGDIEELSLNSLQNNYAEHVIFVRPAEQFSDRSREAVAIQSPHWFTNALVRMVPVYGQVLLASLLVNLFALAMPLFVMNVYDRVVPNQAIETLWVLAIGVTLAFLFDFMLRNLRSYFIDIAAKNADVSLSAKIFEHILGIQMAARPGSVGAFANTVQSFESFRDFITSSTITILVDLPFVIIYIAIIALIGGPLALVPLVMIPISILVGWLLQVPLTTVVKDSYQHAAEKQATLLETLSSAEIIKGLNAEGTMQRRWEQVVIAAAHLGMKSHCLANLGINFSMFLQQATSVIVVIWGVYRIANGDMTTGGLIAVTILTGRALAPMSQVAALLTRYYQSINALQSLNKIMRLPIERPVGKVNLHRPKLLGAIEFKKVSFNYPEQASPALHEVSFKIAAGEHVAIVGRIGSGKTTVAKMILGLYQPTTGNILLDGFEAQQIDAAELRHNIGYVPQDVLLFYGSVRHNIVLGAPHATDDKVLHAAKVAGVDVFVSQHPQGFDLQVGERGARLSGGQRQAITVARAFLNDPPLLVLDEPSNAMDDKTEAQLKNNLAFYTQHKTLIIVTHKGSLLSLVDRIIVMDGGVIVADGSKEEVIKALNEGKIHAPNVQVQL